MNEKDYTIKTVSENGKMGMVITHRPTNIFITKVLSSMASYREERTKAIHELDKIVMEIVNEKENAEASRT